VYAKPNVPCRYPAKKDVNEWSRYLKYGAMSKLVVLNLCVEQYASENNAEIFHSDWEKRSGVDES